MEENAPSVCVVMLAYNNCEHTLRAISSLQQMTYPIDSLVVVDNGSSDDARAVIKRKHPDVTLIENGRNLGFAAGTNVGVRAAIDSNAELVLCINNDVRVSPTMLERLVAAMKPGVGAASPLMYYMNEPGRICSSGFRCHPLLLEARGGLRGQQDPAAWPDRIEVDYLDGTALLLSTALLREVGLFDPRYFFYYEDRDLSARIRRAGYRLITVPSAKLWHAPSATARPGSRFHVYHQARSSVIYFREHTRGWQRPASLCFRLGSAAKKSAKFVARREFALLRVYWQGVRDGWQAGGHDSPLVQLPSSASLRPNPTL